MSQTDSTGKIINFPGKTVLKSDRIDQTNPRIRNSNAQVIAITSGKGGVGKTNIVANLGFALSQMGKNLFC